MDEQKAQDYCQAVLNRFTELMDEATCMPNEHIQKEKEYGIEWRTAFKKELEKIVQQTKRVLSGNGEGDEASEEADYADKANDNLMYLQQTIKVDLDKAHELAQENKAESLDQMVESMVRMESSMHQIKAMLKQPDRSLFDKAMTDAATRQSERANLRL